MNGIVIVFIFLFISVSSTTLSAFSLFSDSSSTFFSAVSSIFGPSLPTDSLSFGLFSVNLSVA
uniref:Candidate secreted effector n=1 Tax=Meloidogyne incognita TaxID=6306 RepID=A0A914KTM6_MELIC